MWKFIKRLFSGKKEEVVEEVVGAKKIVDDVIFHYPKPSTKVRPPRIVVPELAPVAKEDIIAWMQSVKEWEYIRPQMVG